MRDILFAKNDFTGSATLATTQSYQHLQHQRLMSA
jgi:hypothetical protein